MRLLSLDPGTFECGYAVVTDGARGRPRFVAAGMCPSTPAELASLLAPVVGDRPDVVAIETIVAYGAQDKGARMAHLTRTSEVAGVVRGLAHAMGIPVLGITAGEWRKEVLGASGATDAAIARAVALFVEGLPSKLNVHKRDALGLAILAWRMCAHGVGAAVAMVARKGEVTEAKSRGRALARRERNRMTALFEARAAATTQGGKS